MLSAVTLILNAAGERVDASIKRVNGLFYPVALKLGYGLKTSSVAKNGETRVDATVAVDDSVIATKTYADSAGAAAVTASAVASALAAATGPVTIGNESDGYQDLLAGAVIAATNGATIRMAANAGTWTSGTLTLAQSGDPPITDGTLWWALVFVNGGHGGDRFRSVRVYRGEVTGGSAGASLHATIGVDDNTGSWSSVPMSWDWTDGILTFGVGGGGIPSGSFFTGSMLLLA